MEMPDHGINNAFRANTPATLIPKGSMRLVETKPLLHVVQKDKTSALKDAVRDSHRLASY